jgi:hypothetical protein
MSSAVAGEVKITRSFSIMSSSETRGTHHQHMLAVLSGLWRTPVDAAPSQIQRAEVTGIIGPSSPGQLPYGRDAS